MNPKDKAEYFFKLEWGSFSFSYSILGEYVLEPPKGLIK